MTLNNIVIIQSKNEYMLYLENHILVAHIACPPDNAYIADTEVLRILTKGLALRWGVYTGKQQKTQKG